MKKGANATTALKFKRAIKKREQRARKRKNPTIRYTFVEVPAPIAPVKLSWWRRLLKFLHLA